MMQPAAAAGMAPPPPMGGPGMDQQQQQWMMMQQQAVTQPQPPPPPVGVWPGQQVQVQVPPQPQPQAGPPPPALPPQPYPQAMPQPQAMSQAAPQQALQQPACADEIRTLWVGDLQYWMDETYLHGCFAITGEVLSVKIIRNKQTGSSEGYGFVEFSSHAAAERVLQSYNNIQMPNTDQYFRLNWATFGIGEKRPDMGPDYPIFVGDLAADVSDYLLQETFRQKYPSVKGAKVVTDRLTGRSKGYGFVRFGDEAEQARAIQEMNGVFCSSRPMRTGPATTKKTTPSYPQQYSKASVPPPPSASDTDPNNTTIFVGGLDPSVTDETLRQVFGQYGELVHVKIPVGKRCGFVQFSSRACAEEALQQLHGTVLGQQAIRLSWGRSPANKQPVGGWVQPQQPDPSQWNGGYYPYGQGYEGAYPYPPQPQDPNMYSYAPYAAYGNYQQQVN